MMDVIIANIAGQKTIVRTRHKSYRYYDNIISMYVDNGKLIATPSIPMPDEVVGKEMVISYDPIDILGVVSDDGHVDVTDAVLHYHGSDIHITPYNITKVCKLLQNKRLRYRKVIDRRKKEHYDRFFEKKLDF